MSFLKMKVITIVFTLLISLQVQAGFWDTLESLTHKETWKKPVDTVLIVGGVVIAVPAIVGAIKEGGGGTTTNYSGSCPCPYSIASDGSICGDRSAWSKPGGYKPSCY